MPFSKSTSRKDTSYKILKFLAILGLLVKTNQTLEEHLDNSVARNAQYLSPQISE